ncbi:Glycerol kinase [Posidoniimonas corsicana]|uniref:ATP:glycerol 3-phosphotransferase n=1 Tax=Posidoniimonas corsicana TaxID=1938618 RepID=A0A5C5UW53_9BACT|nr:glycerol kinase GlpK [Posidoniimonas corsicana]TWT29787.1 Glycerol kinase [Posidoniimonas corsicana]
MSVLLAIDQSTSSTKAILFDAECRTIDSASVDHRQHYPEPGWVEHDAEEIWRNVLAVTRTVVDRNPGSPPVGVSITNQRETLVVFDKATGRPLCPAIVWQCRRSDPICEELRQAGHGEIVAAATGLKLDSYFSASKVLWLVRNNPDVARKLASGEALIGTVDAYLVYRMTGGDVFATDHTNASRTLLLHLTDRCWDQRLCELFQAPMAALPEVRESFAHFGNTDLGGALMEPAPICGVMGDSQASLFAQRCFTPGESKATFGTGTSVLRNVGDCSTAPPGGSVAALAWVHDGTPTYAWEGLINYSAATITWLRDQLGLIATAEESEALAAQVDDSGGVYLVPAFAGLGAPHWSPDARAAIVGMTAYTNKLHIVRAALESIAHQVRDVLDSMPLDASSAGVLRADGGATRNQLLMQMLADFTRLRVEVADAADFSARGAAMAGLLGLGIVESFDELRHLPADVTNYEPRMPAEQADKLGAGWRDAVRRVL